MLRYPGGKSKIKTPILNKLNYLFNKYPSHEYREPFFGGGSIGLELIKNSNIFKIWINDIDKGISSIWNSIIFFHNDLIHLVNSFIPTVDSFWEFKNYFLNLNDYAILEAGFRKIAIHQISYSGLGVKSGSPLGGSKQESKYKIDCRWSPRKITKDIIEYNVLLNTKQLRCGYCSNFDFEKLILDNKYNSIIYLDPPYFQKGNELYQFGLSNEDHIRLNNLLKETKHKWVLSYDDCEYIRNLYSWAKIEEMEMKATINSVRDKTELLILSE
jgi:DNA adenine methylase